MRSGRLLLPLVLGLTLVIIIVGLRSYLDRNQAVPVLVREAELMGTLWSFQVVPEERGEESAERAIDAAFAELDRIEALMSEWLPESPLSTVNRGAGSGEFVEVPEELADIIRRGLDWGRLSQGAFDISWRGAGNLWRFDEDFIPPTTDAIEEARSRVDYRRIEIDGNRIRLPEGFALGLGGIAKGYAIDRAAQVLREAGFSNFLVNGGGDVFTAGQKGERPWMIGIRDPRGGAEDLVARVRMSGGAVVTSGDYERYRIVDGLRYHHIIDPRSGRPADQCQSVTLVAGEAEAADALATAVFVLGPNAGLQLVSDHEGAEAFVIGSNGRYYMTDGFRSLAEFRED